MKEDEDIEAVFVPCANRRRGLNSVHLYFLDYVSRIFFFLVRCAITNGAGCIGAPVVLAHYK
jgi:hypothetical protein